MELFKSFKSGKKTDENKAGSETDGLTPINGVDLPGIDPPETRYTQEYQNFLALQETIVRCTDLSDEFLSVSPEDFCARFDRCITSLIEEPEYCEVCVFFCSRDDTCRWPEQMQ